MLPRSKIIQKFNSILDDEKTAEILEENVYIDSKKEFSPNVQDDNQDFIQFYMEKSRSIYDNLNPKSYFDTKEAIDKFKKNNDIVLQKNIKDLRFKSLWKVIKQNQEILDKNLMDLKPTMETDQFLCKKCGQRKTTFYTMQIRSADEAETSFITCLVCNYSWREG